MLTDTSQLATIRPITLERGGLLTPFQFFTDGTDNLRVEIVNSASGVTVTVLGRAVDESGKPKALQQTITPSDDRTVTRKDFALGAGALLNLSVFASSGSPLIGQTFVRIQLIRGLAGATLVVGTLLQGYVTAVQDLAFPGSPIRMSTEDAFPTRVIVGTIPAVGTEVSETVPTGARWELVTFTVSLTTSGVAGTRRPRLQFDNGGSTYGLFVVSGTLNLSETRFGCWAIGGLGYDGLGDNVIMGALPPGPALPSGAVIRTNTAGLLAGDQWARPVLCVREQMEIS